MATTSFKPGGYPGQPYGSFAGKETTASSGGPHNPGRITTLWPYGGPGHLYGTFAGKEAATGGTVTTVSGISLVGGIGGGHRGISYLTINPPSTDLLAPVSKLTGISETAYLIDGEPL